MGTPPAAVGDLAELLHVRVDQFAGPLALVGARLGAIEVRVVEVPRHRARTQTEASGTAAASSKQRPDADQDNAQRAPTPSTDQALGVIRNDPEAVGRLLAHIERRRSDGTLSDPEWLPVRNALRLIAGGLPPGIERLS